MRIRELEAIVEKTPKQLFATCDWGMVRVCTPVSTKWYYEKDQKNGGSYKIMESADPWAKCGTGKKQPATGVLVEYFYYDADGVQQESQGKSLVNLKDIGGTWGEFLTLHADGVKERGEARAARLEATAWEKAIAKRIDALGLSFPKEAIMVRRPGDKNFVPLNGRSRVSARSQETYNYPNYLKYEVQGDDSVPRWSPILDVDARTQEDIEYMLQVLEAGTKALAAKEKRRTKAKKK